MYNLKKARQRLDSFSKDPKSSQCPICNHWFGSDSCPHSIDQAKQRLNEFIIGAIARKEIEEYFKRHSKDSGMHKWE